MCRRTRTVASIEPLIDRDVFGPSLARPGSAGCPSAVAVARLVLLVCHSVPRYALSGNPVRVSPRGAAGDLAARAMSVTFL